MPASQVFSGTGSPNGVVFGNPGDLYTDESGGGLYYKTSGVGTNTGWTAIPLTGGTTPSTVATLTEDFFTDDGWGRVVTGTATCHLTANICPGVRPVGCVQMSLNNNADSVVVQLNPTTGSDVAAIFSTVGQGKLTLEWRANNDLVPSLATDYTCRLHFAQAAVLSPSVNGNCLSFVASFDENGNGNWWGVLDNVTKFDLGVPVDPSGTYHRFTVVYDPSVPSVQWFIDGVLKHTFNGTPPLDGLIATMGATALATNAGGDADVIIDYMYFRCDLNRT